MHRLARHQLGDEVSDSVYWNAVLRTDRAFVTPDGQAYTIGDEDGDPAPGFGGRRFRVTYQNGTSEVTHNLRYNGLVPDSFVDLFRVAQVD